MDLTSLPIEFNQIIYVILILLVPTLLLYIRYSISKQEEANKKAELAYRNHIEGIISSQGKAFTELEKKYEIYLESIDEKQDKLLAALMDLRISYTKDSTVLENLNIDHYKRFSVVDRQLENINEKIGTHARRLDSHEVRLAAMESVKK